MSQLPAQPSCRPPGHLSDEGYLAYQQPTAAGSSKSAKVSSESAQRGSQYLRNSPAGMNAQSAVTGLRRSPASPDAIDIDRLLAQLQDSTTEPSSRHAREAQLSPGSEQTGNRSLENRMLSGVQSDLPMHSIAERLERLKKGLCRLEEAKEFQRSKVGATNNQLGRINEDVRKIKTSIDSLMPPLPFAGNSFGDGTQ